MPSDIEPKLFARIMTLPHTLRMDLLEFLGSTRVGSRQISLMIDDLHDHGLCATDQPSLQK